MTPILLSSEPVAGTTLVGYFSIGSYDTTTTDSGYCTKIVDPHQWLEYLGLLEIDDYMPGAQGIGFNDHHAIGQAWRGRVGRWNHFVWDSARSEAPRGRRAGRSCARAKMPRRAGSLRAWMTGTPRR